MNERYVIYYSSSCSGISEKLSAMVRPFSPTAQIVRREIPRWLSPQLLNTIVLNPVDLSFIVCNGEQLATLQVLVNHLRSAQPEAPVLVAYDASSAIIKTRWVGAPGVLSATFGTEGIRALVMEQIDKLQKLHSQKVALNGGQMDSRIIGKSPAFRRVLDLIPKAARSDATTLITGETGTGKEVFARAIHFSGPRRGMPFNAVQCSAIAPDLFENELFGHESGAYTGAGTSTVGLVGVTEKGTLFLDEIDSLRFDLQAKLLRLVEEHEYRPVGSSKARKVDIRIVSATNGDLKALTVKGAFREDLYYRLAGFELKLPSLRERRDDIPTLAEYFLKKYSNKYGRPCPTLTACGLFKLMAYDWPGNVRELAHVIEQAITFFEVEAIDAGCLNLPRTDALSKILPFRVAKARAIEEFEKGFLTQLLLKSDWNISEAARMAQMPRTVFSRRIHKLAITKPHADTEG